MKYKISQEQKDFYRQNGYVAIEGFLDDAELELWRTVTEDAVRQRLIERNGLTNQADPDRYYSQVFIQCVRLADTHEGMARLMLDERLGEAAGDAGGRGRHPHLARSGFDQAAVRQPDGLAPG